MTISIPLLDDIVDPSWGAQVAAQINANTASLLAGNTPTGSGAPAGVGSNGETYYDTTNFRLYRSDGVGWIVMYEPLQTYTPALTNITIGNGTNSGRYKRFGGMCFVKAAFVMGSTSVMGTGPQMSAPKTMDVALGLNEADAATAIYYDATGGRGSGRTFCVSGTTIGFLATNSAATYTIESQVTALIPYTWTTSDLLTFAFTYTMATPYL